MIFKDIEGIVLNVGDTVFRSKFSSLYPHIVLGFTERSVILSCKRVFLEYPDGMRSNYIADTRDTSEHNSKFYLRSYPQWVSGVGYVYGEELQVNSLIKR